MPTPTRYTLPTEMDINGQVLISQLKSLDFNSRNLVLADYLPLQDMAKIDQIIFYTAKNDIVIYDVHKKHGILCELSPDGTVLTKKCDIDGDMEEGIVIP